MIGLLSLPPELRNIIAVYLSPKELFRLSICCRDLWASLNARTRDWAALIDQHGPFKVEQSNAWSLLRTVILNDKVAAIIDAIETEYMETFCDLFPDPADPYTISELPDEDVTLFSRSMEDNKSLRGVFIEAVVMYLDSEEDHLLQSIKLGTCNLALAHLLYLTRNLQSFEYKVPAGTECMLEFLKYTAGQYQNSGNLVANNLPLCNLTRVVVDGSDEDVLDYCSTDWVWLFSRLPSLRKFQGICIGDPYPSSIMANTDIQHKSNVTSLSFSCGGISIGSMNILLDNIQALECFDYHYDDEEVRDHDISFVTALKKNARASLRILILGSQIEYFENEESPSFQDFEQLVRLEYGLRHSSTTSYGGTSQESEASESEASESEASESEASESEASESKTSLRDDVSETDRLIDRLPRTLQSLCLRSVHRNDIAFIIQFLREDIHLLPDLHTFYTDLEFGFEVLEEECANHSIKYAEPEEYRF